MKNENVDPDHITDVLIVKFEECLGLLPPLPSSLHYWDDFDDTRRVSENFKTSTEVAIFVNGKQETIRLHLVHESLRILIKHLMWYLFSIECRPGTINIYSGCLKNIPIHEIANLVSTPADSKQYWRYLRSKYDHPGVFCALKVVLRIWCSNSLGDWTPDYEDYLSTEFPIPAVISYESVSSGDAFLEQDHEKLIVAFFDELSVSLKQGAYYSTHRLEDSAMLMCAYQFGMRPIQIASLKHVDVKDWSNDSDESDSSIHVRFAMAKQKSSGKILYLPRKIKNEWSVVWRELIRRKINAHGRFFSVRSSNEAGAAISRLSMEITEKSIPSGILRHSAAQRLVDGGASNEELAAFMGHSSLQTGLVYYRASPAQAELVNKALGISAVYKKIQHIAHAKFISKEDLAALKGEQQIGGIPHGIPIAGIGGCATGQPVCPYNPVTACYGCSRFMPVVDVEMHKKVLQDFRGVARFFFDESKNESSSPAYLQLKRTITSVEAIIDELEGRGHE